MTLLPMEASSLLSKLKGKTRRIGELLQVGTLSAGQIAKEVGCDENYVWKIKSILKKKGFFQKVELPSEEKPKTLSPAETEQVSHEEPKVQTRSVPMEGASAKAQLKPKERKICHTLFLAGKKPPQVVAKYGFPTEAIEAEYEKFLKYSECDLYEVQKEFMEYFQDDIEAARWEAKELAKRYEVRGYLGNEEFIKMVKLICRKYRDDGRNALADDAYEEPPRGWVKIPCNVCGKPLRSSAVVDPEDVLGRAILKFCKQGGWGHKSCHQE